MERCDTFKLTQPHSRVTIDYSVTGQSSTKLYGNSNVNGHYVTSVDGDTWEDRTYSPSVYTPGALQIIFDEVGNKMFAITNNGKIFRATIDVFNSWTDVSAPNPGTTTGRPDICTHNGTYLFYGNYNTNNIDRAHVYRSADWGDTWAEVLDLPDGRHIHSVYVDPNNSANIFVTVGDANDADKGLWFSSSNGDIGSWVQLSSNYYGIDTLYSSQLNKLVMEGDGNDTPHIIGHPYSRINSPSDTEILVAYDAVSALWEGTARGLHLMPNDDIFYITTSEGGSIPGATKDAIWLADGTNPNNLILLEDITGKTWSYNKTFKMGDYLFNRNQRITAPYTTKERTVASNRAVATNRVAVRDMGTALSFDGVDDYVEVPDADVPASTFTSGFTVSAWIYARGLGEGSEGRIFDKSVGGTDGNGGFFLSLTTSGRVRMEINVGAGVASTVGSVELRKWQLVTAAVTDAAVVRFYRNATLISTPAASGALSGITTTNALRIGQRSAATDRTFDGIIDEPRIWSRALTATEVQNLYRNNIVPQDGLVAEYLFDEATGTTAIDTSGNGNDGVISGCTYTTDTPLQPRTSV